jgi:hypothetical protein
MKKEREKKQNPKEIKSVDKEENYDFVAVAGSYASS